MKKEKDFTWYIKKNNVIKNINNSNNKNNVAEKKVKKVNYELMINERSIFKKSFLIASIGFFIICAIGFIFKFIFDSFDVLKTEIDEVSKFDFGMYKEFLNSNSKGTLAKVSIGAVCLIILSSIINLFWSFRVLKTSKIFMFLSFYFYLIAQGIGFATLFIVWKAMHLMFIFGISGLLLLFLSLIEYLSKEFLSWGKLFLIGWSITWIFMSINLILFFTKVYEKEIEIIAFSVTGFLTLGWLSFQIFSIRKTKHFKYELGKFKYETRFRLKMWWGFRILSDFVLIFSIFGILIRNFRTNKL